MKSLSKICAVTVAFIAMAFTTAIAAVPTVATTAVSTLVTDTGSFIDSLWAIVAIVVVGFIWIKLFKKGANKAT